MSFTVKSGDDVDTIADNLAGLGLIKDKTLFKLQERFSEYHEKEKPGTYELSTSMTPEEMLTVMSGGQDAAGDEAGQDSSEGEAGQESGDESNGG